MAWSRDVANLEALEAALTVLPHIHMKPIRQGEYEHRKQFTLFINLIYFIIN